MKGGFVFLGLVLTTVTVGAAVPAPAPLSSDLGASGPESAFALGAGLVQAAQGGSGTNALQAVLRAQGFHDAPLAVAGPALEGAPPELVAPLGRLLAAAAVAEQLRAAAVAPLTAEEQARVLGQGLWTTTPAAAAPARVPTDGESKSVSVGTGAWSLDEGARGILAKVDPAPFRVAGLTVLAAIEQSALELRLAALRGGAGVASHCGVVGTVVFETQGCEVVVGDSSPNHWATGNIVVAVDLGGDDTYSGAGTALAQGSVRIVVDQAGRDTYTVAAGGAGGAGALAEGIALGALGVAVLADLGGDDRYVATATTTAPQPGPAAGTAAITAQGVANLGAGVLLDAGGKDIFTATATSSGGGASVLAQGQAAGGLGALLNLGNEAGADDTYTVRATSTLHIVFRDARQTQYTIGAVQAEVQGAANLAGAAALVDAGGDDAYLAQPVGGVASLAAQGAGAGGAGAFVDAQGDDTVVARALGDTTLTLVVNNGSSNTCWTVTVTTTTGETKASAQGAASTGAGLLVDGTGNDRRLVEARGHAGAIGGVVTSFACPIALPNRVTTTATSGPGTAEGQGSAAGGVAALVDLQGDDRNELLAGSTARASSIVTGPGARVETATATAGTGQTFGQAETRTGIALVADAGGADEYLSGATSTATRTTGSGGTTVTPGATSQSVQAFGDGGLAWLLDIGGVDRYTNAAAGNDRCWSSGPDGGRGRDVADAVGVVLTPGCP